MSLPDSPFITNKKNYTSKDFVTLREELIALLPIVTKGKWSDISEGDAGIALLEAFLSGVDNLLFYLDQQSLEMNLETAKQRESVIRLLNLIGYQINGVSASKGNATLQVAPGESPIYPVTISKGTQLTAKGSGKTLSFTTLGSASLVGPTDTKTMSVVQGVLNNTSFISDGASGQKFLIDTEKVDKNNLSVYIDEDPNDSVQAVAWEQVSSFYNSTDTSTHYRVTVDANSRITLVFGDGKFGKIPEVNSIINVFYVVTDGIDGNVGRNAITTVSSGVPLVVDAKGNSVKLRVVASEATAGGDDIETIEHAKTTATGLLFGLNKALSRGDYEALMNSIPGVTKAIAWGENEEANPDYRLLNKVRVSFFVKQFQDMFYNPASRASYRSLRDNQVRVLLTARMPLTTRLAFIDPVLQDIFVTVTVGLDLNKYDPNIVLDQIRFSILDAYDIENVNFGQDIRISNLQAIINSIPGVAWSKISRLHTSPPTESPDTAPDPPLDVILEKWKIPTFLDTPISANNITSDAVNPPYIKVVLPEPFTTTIGQQTATVVNPDSQSDILANAISLFPGSNLQHILINYTGITDEPSPSGGFYGSPDRESDYTTFSAIE